MGAPGLTSPIRPEAFQNFQLNAGIFLVNWDYSSYTDADALRTAIKTAINTQSNILGVTRGGGSFTVTRESRTPEVDGMRYPFKGADFIDSADAYLSGTILEVNPLNFKRLLATGDSSISGKITTVTMHTAVNADTDYIEKLIWIGDIADGRLVLIELDNAFNTADFSLTFTDKGEGTMTFEFHARQSSVNDYDNAPFRVKFIEPSGNMGAMTVSSAAGSAVGGTAITTNHTLGGTETYVYKVAATAPTIGYLEAPDYTWTEWDGSSDIAVGAANNGKKITVAVLNNNGKAILSGNATLVVKTT